MVIYLEHKKAVQTKKCVDRLEVTQEQEQCVHGDLRAKRFRRFAQTILELPGVASVREAAKLGGVNRETARKYLSILMDGGLLFSLRFGVNGHVRQIYFVPGASQIDYVAMFVRLFPEMSRVRALPQVIDDALSGKLDIDPGYWRCVRAS